MRAVLVGLLILTGPLAGCAGFSDPAVSIDQPRFPTGMLLTYQVEAENTTTNTFVVQQRGETGYDMLRYNASPDLPTSPFLKLDPTLTPRRFNWSGLFDWPLEAERSYDAKVGGAQATVTLSSTDRVETSGTDTGAIQGVARADGQVVARFTMLESPTVLASLWLDTPDGTRENWTLLEVVEDGRWNQPPDWTIGDWWRYNATTRGESADSTLIFNSNDTNSKGVLQRVLNPQHVEDRIPSLPFLRMRDRDIAPQSGFLSGLLSSFWSWPLEDGKRWTGSTSVGGERNYVASVSLSDRVGLPNDRITSVFEIQARFADDRGGEPFAEWTYAPLVGFLTHAWVERVSTGERAIDWTLLDWGSGFHGEWEVPHRETAYARDFTTGPGTLDEEFEIPDHAERVQIRGRAARAPDGSKNVSFELHDPAGEVVYERGPSDFRDRVIDLTDVVDAVNGTWRLTAEVPEGTSFFLDVRYLWVETRQVDYRAT